MNAMRRIPPTAPPIDYGNLLHGLAGFFKGRRYVAKVEEEMRAFFGVRHVFLVGSGKAALVLILRGLKRLAPGREEVVIPAYTCYSVPSAIVKAGLKVCACDIGENTFDFAHGSIERAIGPKTLCVVPTHLFGIPAEIDRTLNICRRNRVFCVEDAAQAMGGRAGERLLGTVGDAGFFSFGRGKNITCGGGGVVVTDSDAIASEIEREYRDLQAPELVSTLVEYVKTLLMFLFVKPGYYWIPSAVPFLRLGETIFSTSFPVERLSGVKAGLLNGWKRQLDASNSIRAEHSGFYRERVDHGTPAHPQAACLRYPLLVEDRARRDSLVASSGKLGLSPMYPAPVNEIAEIRAQFNGASYPVARSVANRLVTLPTHGFVTVRDREEICRLIDATRPNG